LQLPLVEKAKEMGLRTICFAWPKGAVCKDVCDVFYPVSIVEQDEILRLCRAEQIDGICTIGSDVAAPTVAYVAERMGLPGNSYTAAVQAHDKQQMHRILTGAGVDCPMSNVQYPISNLQLPLIVKPTDRSGSLGVQKVERQAAAR
jgi:carbamoylphosphate synthase large subunit